MQSTTKDSPPKVYRFSKDNLQAFTKVIVSGNVTEVWSYERLNVTGGGKREAGDLEQKSHNYANTQRARRLRIRQLCTTNFDTSNAKFITLTFNDLQSFDITDVKACNAYFKKFIMRLKYRFPDLDLKYLAVIEFQDKNGRNAVHYHMLSNIPYIKKAELASIWGGGFINVNAIDKVDNIGAYVTKYMTKDLQDTRLQGLNAYLHSRNLSDPVVLTSWAKSSAFTLEYDWTVYNLDKKTPVYADTYTSDEAGTVTYYQFNSKRKVTNQPTKTE